MTNRQGDPISHQDAGTTSTRNEELPTVNLAAATGTGDALRTPYVTIEPLQTNPNVAPRAPPRNRGTNLETNIHALEGIATEIAPDDFVSQNYEALAALMQKEAKRRTQRGLQARLDFGSERETSPPKHRRVRRNNRRPKVLDRVGRRVTPDRATSSQNWEDQEDSGRRTNVYARLGRPSVHDRLGGWRSPNENFSGSDSENSRRTRRKTASSSSRTFSDNEESETGHWKSREKSRNLGNRRKRRREVSLSSSDPSNNEEEEAEYWKPKDRHHDQEDEEMSRPWRRQKVDAFTKRISDFSENRRRRMPANVKTYDGTGDPDDHLKIFESAAMIENWPQPVWCHMFNSTLVGNARNWFSNLPRRSIDGFEELRRAFRLNFTQRKKCNKNPVELARVKQRPGESTSAFMERFKDECILVKACPEVLKISGFMNGISNTRSTITIGFPIQ